MKKVVYCLFETPLGSCGIAWSEGGDAPPAVAFFQLPEATAGLTESRIARRSGAGAAGAPPPAIAKIIQRINQHLNGDVQDFQDIAVDLDGAGPFARRVYEAARTIPPGQTTTYGGLARALDHPNASRAVGQALGKNPIALIIPCHRILAAGGRPGGFSAHGGRTTKAMMLAAEGIELEPPPTLKSQKDVRRMAALLKIRDPRLAPYLVEPLTLKLHRGRSPYASLFEAVVRQQLSPKAATTILERVKSLYPGSAIPEPGDLLETPDDQLRAAGLSRAKTAAVKDLATRTLDGTVPTPQEIVVLSDEEIIRRLTSIRGVGRWTAEMLLIFNLGRADVFPVDDYALRSSIAAVYGMCEVPSPKALDGLGDVWRPYRSVAALYLWNALKPKEA